MGQSDDPFDRRGKMVIRPQPGGVPPPNDRFGSELRPPPSGQNTTIISPAPFGAGAGQNVDPAGTWQGGGGAESGMGGAAGGTDDPFAGNWMSPEFPSAQPAAPPISRRRIPLNIALGARANIGIKSANPITQAAAPLLILLGRLRQMVVEMDAVPLMQHVARAIQDFEKRILAAGVPEDQATIAKYALCATADDIVQNLPGTEKHLWLQYSMLAQFFGVRTSGTGFFDKIRQLNANPALYYSLLELIHACLSLGFEGQYRSTKGGDIELQRVRRDVFMTLRTVRPAAGADISPRWRGNEIRAKGLADGIPLWAIAGVILAFVAGFYLLLRVLLGGEIDTVASTLVRLHPAGPVEVSRAAFVPLPEPEPTAATTTQLQRIRGVLAPEIEKDLVAVEPVGESIVIRINNLLLFESGRADVKPDFGQLAQRIAAALNKEPGNIHVIGHTDNVKLRASSRFKSNFELSVKRAQAVADVLAKYLDDAARLDVTGKGEDAPVESNATPEGRAKNRRVELAIPKEESLAN
ncbi:type VI secretion system protein TssL, long form [Sinorhizobium fredii]|uniref:type VI secretion system protein TssL, long form n=1 Tax=Rhizobium fredii TaxID=380 RepID=UPI0004B5DB39|nr:type VI secretion system protein TssL, long form [Sinorhizobium fredii]